MAQQSRFAGSRITPHHPPPGDPGMDSGVDECYDGSERPKGAGYDMGAYDD